MKLVFCVLFFCFFQYVLTDTDHTDPVTEYVPIEQQHSIIQPFDQSQVYWTFGGATVMTKHFIRITPSTQDRRGWLFNEYPLESDAWEVQFKLAIFSKPHFGGDGMGFWVISNDQDPNLNPDNPEILNGPVLGMRKDFKGFGVLFDVYDNDNRRDNPAVFVVKNDGKDTNFDHDNDYMPNMVTKTATVGHNGTQLADKSAYSAYRCVADVRNTGKTHSVLVKFIQKSVHVYIDNEDSQGYKFCLAVDLEQSYRNNHIAFTSATGQVADNVDIVEVTTRYLTEDAKFDDSQFSHLSSSAASLPSSVLVFWIALIIAGAGLTLLAIYEALQISQLKQIDSVRICQQLNALVLPHIIVHAIVSVVVLIAGLWIPFLVQLPLLVYRVFTVVTHAHKLNPAWAKEQNHSLRLGLMISTYICTEFYFLYSFSQA